MFWIQGFPGVNRCLQISARLSIPEDVQGKNSVQQHKLVPVRKGLKIRLSSVNFSFVQISSVICKQEMMGF